MNIVIEPPLYRAMHDLAARQGVSLSTVARELIREGIEGIEFEIRILTVCRQMSICCPG